MDHCTVKKWDWEIRKLSLFFMACINFFCCKNNKTPLLGFSPPLLFKLSKEGYDHTLTFHKSHFKQARELSARQVSKVVLMLHDHEEMRRWTNKPNRGIFASHSPGLVFQRFLEKKCCSQMLLVWAAKYEWAFTVVGVFFYDWWILRRKLNGMRATLTVSLLVTVRGVCIYCKEMIILKSTPIIIIYHFLW